MISLLLIIIYKLPSDAYNDDNSIFLDI